jgi:ribose/xylose/arabinose/galactoside ABC-type transport system permease subunit
MTDVSSPHWLNRLRSRLLRHESLLLFILLAEWICFSCLGRRFATWDNLSDILRHSAEIGLLAVALTPVILTGGIDLSAGSLLGLCAVIFGKLWRDAGLPPVLAALAAIGVGAAGGLLNGSLVTRLKLPPLIVTLGTFSLFRGVAEALTRGTDTFTDFPDSFLFLGQEHILGLPTQAWIFFVLSAAAWILIHRTAAGRNCCGVGFNAEGAVYAGLPLTKILTLAYVGVGTVAGLAAVIYTARLGQARADAGSGYELLAITAVVLGGTSIFGGTGTIHGTLLGVAAIAVLNNGLVHARQPRETAGILTGVLLLVALAITTFAQFRSMRTSLRTQKSQ